MDTLSISLVVHEVIYVPYTYIHKDICYSGKFSAYLDVHLVHIYIYMYVDILYSYLRTLEKIYHDDYSYYSYYYYYYTTATAIATATIATTNYHIILPFF